MQTEAKVREKLWELEAVLKEAKDESVFVHMAVLSGNSEPYEVELMNMEISSIEKQIEWLQWILEER